MKANEGGIQIEKKKKKETRDTNLDISRLQANLSVLSTRGEHKQKKPRPTNRRKKMNMGLLAVSVYQRPKSKQELQVISFNSNATATAVEQPAAEFGSGIAQERCLRSPNRGTN